MQPADYLAADFADLLLTDLKIADRIYIPPLFIIKHAEDLQQRQQVLPNNALNNNSDKSEREEVCVSRERGEQI